MQWINWKESDELSAIVELQSDDYSSNNNFKKRHILPNSWRISSPKINHSAIKRSQILTIRTPKLNNQLTHFYSHKQNPKIKTSCKKNPRRSRLPARGWLPYLSPLWFRRHFLHCRPNEASPSFVFYMGGMAWVHLRVTAHIVYLKWASVVWSRHMEWEIG